MQQTDDNLGVRISQNKEKDSQSEVDAAASSCMKILLSVVHTVLSRRFERLISGVGLPVWVVCDVLFLFLRGFLLQN